MMWCKKQGDEMPQVEIDKRRIEITGQQRWNYP